MLLLHCKMHWKYRTEGRSLVSDQVKDLSWLFWDPPGVYFLLPLFRYFLMWFLAYVGGWCDGVSECSERVLSALGAAQPHTMVQTLSQSKKWIWKEKGAVCLMWSLVWDLTLVSDKHVCLVRRGWCWAGLCLKKCSFGNLDWTDLENFLIVT